jgi:hypothetical protein
MVDLDYLFASKEEKQKIDLAKKQQKEKELQERLEKDKEVDPNVDFNRNPFMYDLKEFDRKKFICLPYKREIDRILKQNYHADASQELDALYEKYINMGDFLGADSCRKGFVTLGSQLKEKSQDLFADYVQQSKRIEMDPRYIASRKTFLFLQKKYPQDKWQQTSQTSRRRHENETDDE